MQENGGIAEVVASRIRCGRIKYREATGNLCDKKDQFKSLREILYKRCEAKNDVWIDQIVGQQ